MQRTTTLALALTAFVAIGARAQAPAQPAPTAQPAAQGPQNTRPGVAIVDFDLGSTIGRNHETAADYDALRRGLAALTLNEMTANQGIRVVERAQLQQIMQEQNLGREGRIEPGTAARIGHIVGAAYTITGTFFDLRGNVKITIRIINSETGEIVKTSDVSGTMDNLYDMVPRLAQQVMRDANLPPMERRASDDFRQANPAPPTQAVMAYSRAVLYADRGDTQRAVEQYRNALQTFPNYTQARTACNALQAGACS